MKKKGFTLIELLAVIVILAILIVIAIPKILNVIDNARESAWNDSVKLVKNAIKLNTSTPDPNTGTYRYTISSLCNDTSKISEIAKVGDMDITCDNNVFTLTGKNKFDSKEATITFDSSENTSEPSSNVGPTNDNIGALVYFDPVSENECNSTHTTSNTCYKWRIISKSENNLTVQLDHVVTYAKWGDSYTSSGPGKILTAVTNATSTWTRVPALNYTYDTTLNGTNGGYNYGILTCTNGICNITKNDTTTLVAGTTANPVRARLITGEEVTTLTKAQGVESNTNADLWTLKRQYTKWYYFSNNDYVLGTQTSGVGNTNLSWLIENTRVRTDSGRNSGSTSALANGYERDINGYYTLSPVYNESEYVWCVYSDGSLYDKIISGNNTDYGARPVITLSKDNFSN